MQTITVYVALSVLVIAFSIPSTALAQSSSNEWPSSCEERWPDDDVSQELCQEHKAREANKSKTPSVRFCEKRWPDDYRMQKNCIDEQEKATSKMMDYIRQHDLNPNDLREGAESGNVPAIIVGKCLSRWENDRRMAYNCIQEQTEAARDLGKM